MEVQPGCSRDDSLEAPKCLLRKELYLVLKSEHFFKFSLLRCNERLFNYILTSLNIKTCDKDFEKTIKSSINDFVKKLFVKWKKCYRIHDRLVKTHANWLNEAFKIPSITITPPLNRKSTGRPKKTFTATCTRSQQRTVQPLVTKHSPEQLTVAMESSLRKTGRRRAARVVQLAIEASPKSLKRMQAAKISTPPYRVYSPEKALALIVDTNMTKESYLKVQRGAKSLGANIYPAYNVISKLKRDCYPENITISESEAKIPIQSLLDHTIGRLLEVQREVFSQHLPIEIEEVDVFYKWGLDGSGGHSIYKQNFAENAKYSDSNIILSTLVPLEISVVQNGNKLIFWKNTSPSSTRWCRPIGFNLLKETNIATQQEYQSIEQQIQEITPTTLPLNSNKNIKFNHITICSMMDGKTCNVLTNTASTQACNVCKVTPKDINDIQKVLERPCNTTAYKYGIPVLHAYLRCFEYLLHVSYKLEEEKWQARGNDAKTAVKKKKETLTKLFYEKLGLVVDRPKQGGGNTNDGNTARKFFERSETVSAITGIDKDLIDRFGNILKVISSGHYVNIQTYRAYCLDTAKKCILLYGWYKMPASVHKLLIHSSDIIGSLPLPVGQLSEDVLEASQKDYKNVRLQHSRKTSREDTNTDIMHWMCISSDPVISALRDTRKQIKKPFNQIVMSMLRNDVHYVVNENDTGETETYSDEENDADDE